MNPEYSFSLIVSYTAIQASRRDVRVGWRDAVRQRGCLTCPFGPVHGGGLTTGSIKLTVNENKLQLCIYQASSPGSQLVLILPAVLTSPLPRLTSLSLGALTRHLGVFKHASAEKKKKKRRRKTHSREEPRADRAGRTKEGREEDKVEGGGEKGEQGC